MSSTTPAAGAERVEQQPGQAEESPAVAPMRALLASCAAAAAVSTPPKPGEEDEPARGCGTSKAA